MLTEDYLMRMINQAIAALVRIVGLKNAGQYEQALQAIDQAVEELTGVRRELLPLIEDGQLLEALTIQGSVDVDRLALLADLFEQQGEVYNAAGKPAEGIQSFSRSLNFNLEVAFNSETPLTHIEKIDALTSRLKSSSLSPEIILSLFSYSELTGRYAEAEQALRGLLLKPERFSYPAISNQAREDYIAFCQRLLALPDDALQSGGLSRKQVQDYLDGTLGTV